jgi:hypothetical protein
VISIRECVTLAGGLQGSTVACMHFRCLGHAMRLCLGGLGMGYQIAKVAGTEAHKHIG